LFIISSLCQWNILKKFDEVDSDLRQGIFGSNFFKKVYMFVRKQVAERNMDYLVHTPRLSEVKGKSAKTPAQKRKEAQGQKRKEARLESVKQCLVY